MQISKEAFKAIAHHCDEISDNRFAVISGQHIDLTRYDSTYVAIIYEAEDCLNMSEAHADYMADEAILEIHRFEEIKEANEFFIAFISGRLGQFAEFEI